MEEGSILACIETPGDKVTRREASSDRFQKAMSTNDIRYLERVEQYSLTKTQPGRGKCRRIRPVTVYFLAQRDDYGRKEAHR